MTERPVIHHAIVRGPYGGHRVVAVTTEKTSGRWYGRTVPEGDTTHGSGRVVVSRHRTSAEALSRLSVINSVQDQYHQRASVITSQLERIQRMRADATARALTGAVPDPLPTPVVLWPDSIISMELMTQILRQYVAQSSAISLWDEELRALAACT